ncbi:MAG TPA: orotate phosphoribosyltransferase [Candidatus Bathyarchaeia archaeon]|nr:orotate phosphoribosyltransferase [Candidatus Bathyarchaeia archaeon]
MSDQKETMKTELCRVLHKIGALKFGTFKLASGRISPYYIDLRIVPSFPDAFRKICELYTTLINVTVGLRKFDRIAAVPTAGMAFASVVAYGFRKPFLYTRPKVKTHGRERRIEGIIMPGNRVLIVDDLITTGRSLIQALTAIRAEGGVVNDAVVLVNREEGGKEKLASHDVTLHYLLDASEAADKLYEIGAITEEQLETIIKQTKKSGTD